MLKRLLKAFMWGVLATLLFYCSALASWTFIYPINVVDTSNTTRTTYPVIFQFGGTQLVNQGLISSNGTDTNMQIGAVNAKYMMSTTNICAVVPSITAGSVTTLSLYTGYFPLQSSFSIIPGYGGNVSVTNNASLALGGNFSATYKGDIDTTINNTFWNQLGSYSFNTSSNGSIIFYAPNSTQPMIVDNATGTETTTTSSHTFNITSHNTGDLLVLVICSDVQSYTLPTGWISGVNTTSSSAKMMIWYKFSDGTEGTTLAATSAGNARTASIAYRITSAGSVLFGTPATGSSTTPDPPSVNATGILPPKLWLAAYTAGRSGSWSQTANPTGYSQNVTVYGTGTTYPNIGLGIAANTATNLIENPDAFTLNASTAWVAETIAVSGKDVTLTAGSQTGLKTVTANVQSGNVSLYIDDVLKDTVLFQSGGVLTNTNNITLMGLNSPYADNITLSVNNTLVLWLNPNVMLVGGSIPDRSGFGNTGTINFGANSGLNIIVGEPTSFASTTAATNQTAGFTVGGATMPSTWYARGENLSQLPFYDAFSNVANQDGRPVQFYYMLASLGFALGTFILIVMFTRSALLAYIAMLLILGIASSMTIIPAWLVFALAVVGVSIMYLYGQFRLGG